MAVLKRGEASSRVTTLLDRVGQGGASKRVRLEMPPQRRHRQTQAGGGG
jgi:hypothetical protein